MNNIIGPILTYFIKDLEDYLITYLLGVSPSIVSLILTIFIKTERIGNIDEKLIKNIEENKNDKLVDRFTTTSEDDNNQSNQ